jgi:hypothetical protein
LDSRGKEEEVEEEREKSYWDESVKWEIRCHEQELKHRRERKGGDCMWWSINFNSSSKKEVFIPRLDRAADVRHVIYANLIFLPWAKNQQQLLLQNQNLQHWHQA